MHYRIVTLALPLYTLCHECLNRESVKDGLDLYAWSYDMTQKLGVAKCYFECSHSPVVLSPMIFYCIYFWTDYQDQFK
jgi:hypothetical protein